MDIQMRSNKLWQCASMALAFLLTVTALGGTGAAQSFKAVASFPGAGAEAAPQVVTPAQGRNGALYGSTRGSSGSSGALFQLATIGTLRFPYTFSSATGGEPNGGVILATDGNLYGTTTLGGNNGNGVLYRLSPTGAYTVLHDFANGSDGANPVYAPIEGSDRNIYGITTPNSASSAVLYKYAPSTSTFSTLYTFGEPAASEYPTSLIQAANGNLYGTVSGGICGEIFELTTSGALVWSYNFTCPKVGQAAGGSAPVQMLQASDGNFYGATLNGGSSLGYGVIFKLDQMGNVSVIYTFPNSGQYGAAPVGLTEGTDGNIYGATIGAGKYRGGTLFQLTTSGNITLLYSLNSKTGSGPLAPPVQHTDGTFYGTTESGGKANAGVVYSLNMGLGPFVKFVLPTGPVGQTAQILGQGLTGTTVVTFNGVAATSFKVVSDTFMTAVIPSGATTGPVVVTTPSGALTSNVSFRVIP
jgi:uncharacterized repeat protein (TIGR03803 family)